MRLTRAISYIVALLVAGVAGAQTVPDLTGTWDLTSQVTIPGEELPCNYSGQAMITQNGTEISGTAQQSFVSGPASCPAEMAASLSGYFDGTRQMVVLNGSLMGGQLGTLYFSGDISRDQGGGGSFGVETGPFAGAGGSWSALLRQQLEAIPALTPLGLTLLVVLLLGLGALLLRRRQPA